MTDELRILVAGLGGIGGGMASRLVDRGWDVVGLDPDPTRRDAWTSDTGRQAYASASDPSAWIDVSRVVVAVRTEEQVMSVLEAGSERARPDLVVHLVSTVRPSFWDAVFEQIPSGWRLVECPVTGGEGPARRGEITMLLANHTEADATLIADLAGATAQFDELRQPSLMKLINNSLAAMNAANVARCMDFAERRGLPGRRFLEALELGSGRSMMSENLARLSANQFDLLEKDLGLLLQDFTDAPVGGADGLSALVSVALRGEGAAETAL